MTTHPEGSIRLRADGRWEGRTTINGKRISRYGHTRDEVVAAIASLADPDEPLSLAVWVERAILARQLRPTAEATYNRVLKPILADLGHVPLVELNPPMLNLQFSMMHQRRIGPRQIQLAHGYLRAILDQAVAVEHLARNPMANLKQPKWAPRIHRYWTSSETQAFLSTCLGSRRRYAPLFALMVATGLRISEALGIEAADVDTELGTLTVSRAWVFVPGRGYSLEAPKTASSRRVISVPIIVLPALTRVPIRTRNGKLPGPGDLRAYLTALCALAGVPRLSPHGLRHVHAALAYHVSGDAYAVQKRLGHSNVTTTMGIYGFGMGRDGVIRDGLDTLLSRPEAPPNPDPQYPGQQVAD